jgi:hypothetical protein
MTHMLAIYFHTLRHPSFNSITIRNSPYIISKNYSIFSNNARLSGTFFDAFSV